LFFAGILSAEVSRFARFSQHFPARAAMSTIILF